MLAPVVAQAGVAPEQSVFAVQATHWLIIAPKLAQTGVGAEHLPSTIALSHQTQVLALAPDWAQTVFIDKPAVQ